MSCLRPINLGSQVVPCGQCLGCLEDRQKIWYFRNMLEWHYNSNEAFFITLTYDDVHLPWIDGEVGMIPVISKNDVYGFLKRLKYHIPKFRYFGVSEYSPGPNYRPHFHIILYLEEVLSLQYVTESVLKTWSEKYTSKGIAVPYGRVQVELLSAGRISYVTMYLLAKVFNENYSELPGDFRPKSFMSRRPGIGDRSDNKQLKKFFNENPFISYMCFPDGSKMCIPRYFRDRMFSPTAKRLRSVCLKIEQSEKQMFSSEYSQLLQSQYRRKYYLKSLKRSNSE